MAPETSDQHPSPFTRKSRYILVVEGNTSDLFTTAMLLHRFNYPVCTARNARQALDMVSVAMPALVMTDLMLPGMNGLELMRVLGGNSHTFNIPVVLMVPPGGRGHEKEVEIGSQHVLRKPLAVEELYRAVQSIMELTPRRNLRVPAELPVTLDKVPLDSGRGECCTHISSQGMYIRTFKYHARDEHLTLQVTIGGRVINADATVLYTRRQDAGPFAEPGMAVKFTRIMAEDREFIRKYVHDEVTKGIVTELPQTA
jgi:CheY-like chemotaxis protein